MTYPFTVLSIPNANDDPTISQSQLQTNFRNLNGWSNEDHVQYGSTNAGQHTRIRFPTFNAGAGNPTGNASVAFTNAGTASAVAAQSFFRNANATYHTSAIKCWAYCNGGGVIASQSYNVSSVVRSAQGEYVVTMPANVVSSQNYAVLVSPNMSSFVAGSIPGYTITSATTFTLFFRALTGAFGVDPDYFSFQVMQI